jgi:hypothetical protein
MSEFKTNRASVGNAYERVEMGETKKGDMHKPAMKHGASPRAGSPGSKKVRPQRG